MLPKYHGADRIRSNEGMDELREAKYLAFGRDQVKPNIWPSAAISLLLMSLMASAMSVGMSCPFARKAIATSERPKAVREI